MNHDPIFGTPDALDFDRQCDGSLPLEEMIRPDPKVRKLLQDIDRTKTRVWALTNAYQTVCAMLAFRPQLSFMFLSFSTLEKF